MSARALGLLAGYVADRIWGDPARLHPVAGLGTLAERLERHLYADDRRAGVAYTASLVGGAALAGVAIERATARRPIVRFLATASTTWAVLGSRSLEAEARAVRDHLAAGDLPSARQRLTHLVGRDTNELDEAAVARAVIESVAENTSDAVVAPLLAGAVAGIPGLAAYRTANTLDAMVGHRNERYTRFGWASARLDDVLNWVPARVCAAFVVGLAPTVGGDPATAWRIWQRDASAHPSPNAGPIEAAFAGTLDVQLGGVNQYDGRLEDRHTLGDGRPAQPRDIEAATHLSVMVGVTSAIAAAIATIVLNRKQHP